MASELATRPTATTLDVETLVTMAWRGEIRVPHFQRDFRWQRRDVIRLFESILRGYPIGSLLLWRRRAPAQRLKLAALTINAPASERALWVVDGQQRITSLANALHPDALTDERFKIAYDLETRQFGPVPVVEEDPLVIPLPVLFDLQKLLGWFHQHPEVAGHVDQANEVTKILRQFPIPAYEVVHDEPRVLQDIFDRMNNYGKRLSRAEVFSALFAGAEVARDSRITFERIAEGIDEDLGFGILDNDTVLYAILARRGPDVRREIRNEFSKDQTDRAPLAPRAIIEFPDEDQQTAYQLGDEALRRAVRFLQTTANVPHVTMLPYRYLLVVLTRFFAHHPGPDEATLRLLRRWFWRAAVVGPDRFRGSTTGAIRFLCYAVDRNDQSRTISGLLGLVDRPDSPLPDLRRFRSNEAGTKIVLCAWWNQRPRLLRSGEVISRETLSTCLLDRTTAFDAVRYIIARQSVPRDYRMWAADRVLLPDEDVDGDAVDSVLTSRPLDVEPVQWQAVLHSHTLDEHLAGLLRAGKVVEFLTARQKRLHHQLSTFLRRMCEWEFEDTPALADLVVEDLADGDDEPA